jgi:murein DD-endopeptidase MepM/ murein hydrolase activator NlpD
MVRTTFPVSQAINWGAMDRPQAWNRTYAEMMPGDFVPVPAYDMQKLTVPMQSLLQPRNIPEITRKLFYSTRFFGAYDLDSGEWTAVHPAIDIKMPIGTPVLAAAGGRVYSVTQSQTLGLHVLIEHRHPTDGTFYSIYGHLGSVAVQAGDDVLPGQTIGFVGMTGNTSGPHVHFQVDRKTSIEPHIVYFPDSVPSHAEAAKWVMHPITFLQNYAAGVQ